MLCKDMIKLMEKLIEENKPHEAIMGEAEVVIDIFRENIGGTFEYVGFSPDVRITPSGDGAYNILTAFEDDKR